MVQNCNYLYGIVPADAPKDFGAIGLDGATVVTISDRGVGIVASESERIAFGEIAPDKTLQYLAQHQRVLERVMRDLPVIPLKFGTYAADAQRVLEIIRGGRSQFAPAIEKYADKVEVDVAAFWTDLKLVLAEIGNEEVVTSATARIDNQSQATTAQRVRVGQLVKELLQRKNKAIAERLLSPLRNKWRNVVVNPARDDSVLLNAAVLIRRTEEAEFDELLEQLDRGSDGRINFRRVGPLPPYSFATAEVKTIEPNGLDAARQTLGLGESASLVEIKAAYRQLLQKLHPDKNDDPQASDGVKEASDAHELLEQYAMNVRHTFDSDRAAPVIATIKSLEDLRAAATAPGRQDESERQAYVATEAA